MASFNPTNTSNVSSKLFGRELSIASSFVKQYYTLLNKAPCYIHNFYSQDSTFIHGTIEMANEHYTEPTIGRDKIKRKIEDLKLNDCRAKIKQIDSLETLAGGLVIQVIGELSNNGRPMRRFLQTFVLAPSPDETRQEGDSNPRSSSTTTRGGINVNETSHNQKFYVMNNIFRYQDDGPDSEYEDDSSSVHANSTADVINGCDQDGSKVESATKQQAPINVTTSSNTNGPVANDQIHGNLNRRRQVDNSARTIDSSVDRLANELDEGVKLNKPSQDLAQTNTTAGSGELKRESDHHKEVPNGSGLLDKKSDASVNVKTTNANTQALKSNAPNQPIMNQNLPTARPQPSNEPKTWANIIRNYQPPTPTATTQQNAIKSQGTPPGQGGEVQPQNSKQMQPNQQSQQNQQQQNKPQSVQTINNGGPNNNNNNNNNNSNSNNSNRRRHTMRKPSNKSTGRAIKPRPRQAPVAAPPQPPTASPGPTATVKPPA